MKKVYPIIFSFILGIMAASARDFEFTHEGQTLTYTVLNETSRTCQPKAGSVSSTSLTSGQTVSGSLIIPAKASDGTAEFTVTSIPDCAFLGSSGLTSLVIPETVTSIGQYAFRGIGITELTMPGSITSIGFGAFANCSSLTKADVGSSVALIDQYVFYGCTALAEVSIPASVTEIYDYAFYGCAALTKAEFASIESLCAIDFSDATSNPLYYAHHLYVGGREITELTIPGSVNQVGYYAFAGCSELKSLTIPASVSYIGSEAFAGCTSLQRVTCESATPPQQLVAGAFDEATYAEVPLYIPEGTINAYMISNWGAFSHLVAGSKSIDLVTFDDGVFNYRLGDGKAIILPSYRYSTLAEVSIPERFTDSTDPDNPVRYTVMGISEGAFRNCTKLTRLSFNSRSTLTHIGESAFSNCTSLSSVTLPETLTNIGNLTFNGCTSLPAITLPDAVKTMGYMAFYDCSSLSQVKLSASLTSVPASAFAYCTALTSIDLPGSIKSIGGSAFSGCSALADVSFPYSIKNIGSSAFYATALKQISLPESVTSIGSTAFANCKKLEEVSISNSVESIGNDAFNGCSALKKLTLGSGLTEIGNRAFYGCSLQEVVVAPAVETIGENAFAQNTALTSVKMGHGLTSVGENAFNGCPVENVYITAPNPPAASNNTFSRYSASLWIVADAVDAYYDALRCWDRFDSFTMVEPTDLSIVGDPTMMASPGDTIRLSASIEPAEVTLPHIFWRSTNPAVATVDTDGVVVIRSDEPQECQIIAESLYADGPMASVTINPGLSAIEAIGADSPAAAQIDFSQPIEVYNLQGMRLSDSLTNLAPGLYIIRQGAAAAKHLIR